MLSFKSLEQIGKLVIQQKNVVETPIPRHIGLIPSLALKLVAIECVEMPVGVAEQLLSELCEL